MSQIIKESYCCLCVRILILEASDGLVNWWSKLKVVHWSINDHSSRSSIFTSIAINTKKISCFCTDGKISVRINLPLLLYVGKVKSSQSSLQPMWNLGQTVIGYGPGQEPWTVIKNVLSQCDCVTSSWPGPYSMTACSQCHIGCWLDWELFTLPFYTTDHY